jgi:hypothetical protein
MKTKKEILKWWEELGKGEYQGNDLYDFYQSIELPYTEYNEGLWRNITIFPKRCKYPIYLYFYKTECIKIKGF